MRHMCMTLALAHAAAEGSGFNPNFYVAAATLIPVLFIALAFEGRFISALLKASSWAIDTVGDFVVAYILYLVLKGFGLVKPKAAPAKPRSRPRRPPGRLRRMWRRIAPDSKPAGSRPLSLLASPWPWSQPFSPSASSFSVQSPRSLPSSPCTTRAPIPGQARSYSRSSSS